MVTIDLITGFLGSGKTTFLKKYAEYLMDQGLHIGILENDFGAINVDMLMLHELRGDQCELEMIAGGCDAESHRRRFRTKLISMRMCGYDRVLVEPSGIYDVDEFFDVLREEPLDQWYEIGNVIAILDARLENNLSPQADYLLASEAANAGKVILSHADAATRKQCEDTVAHLNRALEQLRCDRRIDPEKDILQTNLTDLTKEDLQEVSKCGYRLESYRKMDLENEQSFDSFIFHGREDYTRGSGTRSAQTVCRQVLRRSIPDQGFCEKRSRTMDGIECYTGQSYNAVCCSGAGGADRHRGAFTGR
mgnify:CR=1 FL=1